MTSDLAVGVAATVNLVVAVATTFDLVAAAIVDLVAAATSTFWTGRGRRVVGTRK